jgi:hypothetical protein
MKFLFIILFFSLTVFLYNEGYTITWIRQKIQSLRLLYKVSKSFSSADSSNGILAITENIKSQHQQNFTINNNNKIATLSYQYVGQTYNIQVPYDIGKIISMGQFKVELLQLDNTYRDITQQPGIPYLVSAKSLGGISIRFLNCENLKTHNYNDDQIPGYGIEVMDED